MLPLFYIQFLPSLSMTWTGWLQWLDSGIWLAGLNWSSFKTSCVWTPSTFGDPTMNETLKWCTSLLPIMMWNQSGGDGVVLGIGLLTACDFWSPPVVTVVTQVLKADYLSFCLSVITAWCLTLSLAWYQWKVTNRNVKLEILLPFSFLFFILTCERIFIKMHKCGK